MTERRRQLLLMSFWCADQKVILYKWINLCTERRDKPDINTTHLYPGPLLSLSSRFVVWSTFIFWLTCMGGFYRTCWKHRTNNVLICWKFAFALMSHWLCPWPGLKANQKTLTFRKTLSLWFGFSRIVIIIMLAAKQLFSKQKQFKDNIPFT